MYRISWDHWFFVGHRHGACGVLAIIRRCRYLFKNQSILLQVAQNGTITCRHRGKQARMTFLRCRRSVDRELVGWVRGRHRHQGGRERGREDAVGHGYGGREMLLICLSICRASLGCGNCAQDEDKFAPSDAFVWRRLSFCLSLAVLMRFIELRFCRSRAILQLSEPAMTASIAASSFLPFNKNFHCFSSKNSVWFPSDFSSRSAAFRVLLFIFGFHVRRTKFRVSEHGYRTSP